MKMWLYGPIVVLVTLLSGCEAAGVGDEVDGRTDLQAGAVSLTGTVATQVDLNSFSAIEFDYPSEAVFFFLIDSGGSGAVANYATSASTDYSFELTIPVPEDRSLQLPPEGISSRDPEARILSLDLYGAREDALVYGESDILAYGRIDGVRGRQETVRATTLRYIYSDRPTILHGEDAETGMVADALSLESGWNEVLQISAFEYDRDATLVGSSQTLINGSPPERSNWFLLGNYLPARIESRKLSRSQQVQDAATFIAFDSANPESQELFVRATVGESIELSTPGRTDITGRQVLLYFMLKDSDNADGTIENSTTRDTPDYVRGSDGGTDLLEVFMLIYSDQRNPALMAGTRNAEEAATPDGTPVDNYLQIGNAG
ncbi:MAG: hypothetical protein ACLFPW_02555 [Spirochaetaceae bacterium]